ncbi:MAG: ectoine hydroxylase-related dioxygenase (phytanoyl-CoA dioxygenase family) [Halieaceae bacterium]|jgi:ectoine hydroxylase-related dioxygenase (phytanoyl-CoA dioxygenase family)
MLDSSTIVRAEQNSPLVISKVDEDRKVLKARFDQYGYLYFQRAIAVAKCANLLHSFLDQLDPHIVYSEATGQPVLHGEPFFETDPVWDVVYPKMQSLYEFHNFFHDDDALELMRVVCAEDIFVYPMKMGRIASPRKIGYETPPHQDAHSHQAGPSMAGFWVALHDVKQGMGRLKMLPGSHKKGVRDVFEATGVGGVQCEIFDAETTWHVSDVAQGDVIIFHSCCVHKAEPNTTEDSVRISIDTRFCDYGESVFATNFEPHHGWRIDGFDWESIYASWTDQGLKYYWRDYKTDREAPHNER